MGFIIIEIKKGNKGIFMVVPLLLRSLLAYFQYNEEKE